MKYCMYFLILILWPLTGCQKNLSPQNTMYRLSSESNMALVEIEINNQGPFLFQINPGYPFSFVHPEIVEEVGLPKRANRKFTKDTTTLTMTIGGKQIKDVQMIINDRGFIQSTGALPVHGILGMDIFKDHILKISYGGQSYEVFEQNSDFKWPESTINFTTKNRLLVIPMELHFQTKDGSVSRKHVDVSLDPFSNAIYLNTMDFDKDQAEVEVNSFKIGETTFNGPFNAKLIPSNEPSINFEMFKEYDLIIDQKNNKMAVMPTNILRKQKNINQVKLQQMEWSFNANTDKLLLAKLQIQDRQFKNALRNLIRYTKENPENDEAQQLLAGTAKTLRDFQKYHSISEVFSVTKLIEKNLLVDLTNSMWLNGDKKKSKELIDKALKQHTEEVATWVSFADYLRFEGKPDESSTALSTAVNISGNPDAFLLRRAWTAHQLGDHLAALTFLRRLLQLNTTRSELWFYSQLYKESPYVDILERDVMNDAKALSSQSRGLDFYAAALIQIGQTKLAKEIALDGIERDCQTLDKKSDKINCLHWFSAMLAENTRQAVKEMKSLVKKYPYRSDYIDTYAVLLYINGDKQQAYEQSLRAAQISAADPYMLWQLEYHRVTQ